MLIVALQDDIDNLYAIWNTTTDRFLGVNLTRDWAMDTIIQYKHCSIAEANSRLDNPQPFKDIAKCLCEEFNRDDNKIETATQYLKEMSWEIGTVSAECLSESDGKKMRECVAILESRIDELER
nr:MAG TPA: hypothetical protein [Bacteriophage sp.]